MFKPLTLFLGVRYAINRQKEKRNTHFLSIVTLTSKVGLIISVATMIVVLSVMNGFDYEFQKRVLGMMAHVNIYAKHPISNWESLAHTLDSEKGIVSISPYIYMQGMLVSKDKMQKVMLKGVHPIKELQASSVGEFISSNKFKSLKARTFGIFIGDRMAKSLQVSIGDKVTLISPHFSITPGGLLPRTKRFTVLDIFHVGIGEIDTHLAITNVQDLAVFRYWDKYEVEGIRLKVRDVLDAPDVASKLKRKLKGSYYVNNWTLTYGDLYKAIHEQKYMVSILLFLIIGVAAFNIISTVVLVVHDRRNDIAILRTLGCTKGQIMSIFIIQGTLVGFSGTFIGSLLGAVISENITLVATYIEKLINYKFLNSKIYFIDYIPSSLKMEEVFVVSGIAILLSLLATIYPAWDATRDY